MNIKRAKEEIEHTVKAYLAKDALGEYAIPSIRQRPILLMGPPGIGKTQIMEQAARECGVALVAYTITHHTRQSAVGLPFIRQRHYGDKDVSVTEYTMSEIISSVYAKMEATGLKEGILFIDEINCVSETLAPTMLQFLQCKTFGNQAVPAGWVIVAAGNPPEYNKSVRDFDIVTLDRVRRMDIEPDLQVWKDYARTAHIHSAILSYLDLHPQNFYQINADVDGTQFVTARGWEDLSNLLDTYESLGLQADEALIRQYLQHQKIAEDFSAYLDLYYKYRDDYGVEEILAGQVKPAVYARLLNAPFDERLSLVSLILSGLNTRFTASRQADAVADACYAFLREAKQGFSTLPADIPDGELTLFGQMVTDYDAETQRQRAAGLLGHDALNTRLQVYAALRSWDAELRRANAVSTQPAFDLLRTQFQSLAEARDQAQEAASTALEAAFDFMENAFAESQEMVVFVTELTLNLLPMPSSPKMAATAISGTTKTCCSTIARPHCSRSLPPKPAATEGSKHPLFMRKEAPHPGEDEALLYFVQVRDELVFHGPADVHHKEDSDTFSQAFIFAILPKFYAIQPRTQQEAEKGIGQNRQAQQNKSSSDPCKKCTCCIQHCNIKHQPAAVFQTMLAWRKPRLLHHSPEQPAKSSYADHKLHQIPK